ncbi:MAG: plasmid recombination protein [Lachnospiraceae bacterium]|nr:plasmid recombination protein [Lachnospiraceae bacterium]
MASIIKHGAKTLYYIRHNMRELPKDKTPSNIEIDPERTKNNIHFIARGKTAEQVNNYRKRLEKKFFKYNRKNLVHSIEVVSTVPRDCPPDQIEKFCWETINYVASTIPGGMDCIFQAVLHTDEGVIQRDRKTVLVSPPHLHIMYIPAVLDHKHTGYEYKLCADELTKKAVLRKWHPNYQKWLDQAGVKATVYNGKTKTKNIKVEALKQITKETGLTIDEIKDLKFTNERMINQHQNDINQIIELAEAIHSKEAIITKLQESIERSHHDWNRNNELEISNGWGTHNRWNKDQEIKRAW